MSPRPAFHAILLGLLLVSSATEVAAQARSIAVSEPGVSGQLYIPARTPAPAIFVLHSLYGRVHPADLVMAAALNDGGFVAFAIEYPIAAPTDAWAPAYLRWLKARPEVAGQPLGAVGFSAGGARAFQVAALDPSVKAVVSYYGTYDYATSPLKNLRAHPENGPIRLVDRINAASLMLHGASDSEVPREQIDHMKAALLAKGLPAEVVIYPGAYHNFDRGPEGPGDRTSNGTLVAYDGNAAVDAQNRTLAWFKTYLK